MLVISTSIFSTQRDWWCHGFEPWLSRFDGVKHLSWRSNNSTGYIPGIQALRVSVAHASILVRITIVRVWQACTNLQLCRWWVPCIQGHSCSEYPLFEQVSYPIHSAVWWDPNHCWQPARSSEVRQNWKILKSATVFRYKIARHAFLERQKSVKPEQSEFTL